MKLRSEVVGREKWLFVGSDEGGLNAVRIAPEAVDAWKDDDGRRPARRYPMTAARSV